MVAMLAKARLRIHHFACPTVIARRESKDDVAARGQFRSRMPQSFALLAERWQPLIKLEQGIAITYNWFDSEVRKPVKDASQIA
jgi:hypothetical protein